MAQAPSRRSTAKLQRSSRLMWPAGSQPLALALASPLALVAPLVLASLVLASPLALAPAPPAGGASWPTRGAIARCSSQAALREGWYGVSQASSPRARRSSASAEDRPCTRRGRWRTMLLNPPKDKGLWPAPASPTCSTRSQPGGSGASA